MNKIFVQVAAYRDPECLPTLLDLFQKAARPRQVFVAVCWQFLPGVDPETLRLGPFRDQVRIIAVDASRTRGVCWARHLAERQFGHEDYVLQIDSHMRFVPNWDELMLDELERCGDLKAVLTCNPSPYHLPDRLDPNPRPIVKRATSFMPSGDFRSFPESLDCYPVTPVLTAFVSGSFLFAKGDLIQQVPVDPWYYFNQEEITYSIRLFTHGWNLYCPSLVLNYHYYYDSASPLERRPLHWKHCKEWVEYQRIGNARFNHLSKFSEETDPSVLVDIDNYPLGSVRSLEEYQSFCGVDFKTKTVNDHGVQLRFIPGIERLRKNPVRFTIPKPQTVTQDKEHKASDSSQEINSLQSPEPTSSCRFTTVLWQLKVGDFVPFFALPAVGGTIREIHGYAGKPVVLLFFAHPSHNNTCVLGETLTRLSAELGDRFSAVCIIPGGTESRRHEASFAEPGRVWIDSDGSVFRMFGIVFNGEAASLGGWAVLTPNLRVAALECFSQLDQDTGKIRAVINSLERGPPETIKRAHAPVLLVDNVLSHTQCTWLIEHWRTGDRFDGKVGAKPAYDPQAKIRTDCVLPRDARDEVDRLLVRRLLPEILKVFNVKITRREPYKIGCYAAEKAGHFRPHRDNFEPSLSHRRLAVTINLNDGFLGGGVVFPEYGNAEYTPHPGCALVFPCTLVHGVSHMTTGERFMILSFLYSEKEHRDLLERHRSEGTTLGYNNKLLVEW